MDQYKSSSSLAWDIQKYYRMLNGLTDQFCREISRASAIQTDKQTVIARSTWNGLRRICPKRTMDLRAIFIDVTLLGRSKWCLLSFHIYDSSLSDSYGVWSLTKYLIFLGGALECYCQRTRYSRRASDLVLFTIILRAIYWKRNLEGKFNKIYCFTAL